ncbi:MAG: peptidase E [Patescibacteria group bacterium]
MAASRKIVAIGGGEIGRAGYSVETTTIDKEIIRLTGKKHPKLLFLPTASGDSVGYFEDIENHFGKELGCKTDVLNLIKDKPSFDQIKTIIYNSDIVYVGGGNTLRMMKIWRRLGIDEILKEAYEKGIVMSGVSAGAICWFAFGNSDSRKFKNPEAGLISVRGLGFVDALFTPHYDVEADRKPELKKMMKKKPGIAIACDNCSAIEIVDDKYRIITSKSSANAYKVYWNRGKFFEKVIEKASSFQSLSELIKKQ